MWYTDNDVCTANVSSDLATLSTRPNEVIMVFCVVYSVQA